MKIKYDKSNSCWYVCKKECLTIGKLYWTIIATFKTKQEAKQFLENNHDTQ